MRKLIIQTLAFIGLVIAMVVLATALVNTTIRSKAIAGIGNNAQNLILGHSHAECAFNDSIIPAFCNRAESGEAYFYTFLKTKLLLKNNTATRSVFIEFSNNQITEVMDEWTWGNSLAFKFVTTLFPFMSTADHAFLLKHNTKGYLNNASLASKKNMDRLFSNNLNYAKLLGGYLPLDVFKTDSLLLIQSKNKTARAYDQLSLTNLSWLRKTIDYCRQHGMRVYLLRSPVHKEYDYLQNELLFQKVRSASFGDVEFLDFLEFPLANSEYADIEHLNRNGAKKFSGWFNTLIQNGLLEKTNKQEMIAAEIKNINMR